MSKILTSVMFLSISLLASDQNGHTDIVPRLVNFIIFVGIAYYLLGEKVKSIFTTRTSEIASKFEEIENKLSQTQALKEEARQKVVLANRRADDIIANAKKESELMAEKIVADTKKEIVLLEKHNQEVMDTEMRKVTSKCIKAIFEEEFRNKHFIKDANDYVTLIEKKVA